MSLAAFVKAVSASTCETISPFEKWGQIGVSPHLGNLPWRTWRG